MTIAEIRGGTPTTFTYTGNATVENAAEDATFSALGAGWTVGGLEKIIPATGGVILDEGSGSVAWFSGSFGGGGGTYTSPAGTFSTLVLNSGGTYTLTETDGTKENFNSSGLETTSVDRNGLTTTFGYSSSLLEDHHRSVLPGPRHSHITAAISSSRSRTPTSRLTTFTHVERRPDRRGISRRLDLGLWLRRSGRMTSVTEPSSAGEPTKITTITYDSAERVGTDHPARQHDRGVLAGPDPGLDQQRHHRAARRRRCCWPRSARPTPTRWDKSTTDEPDWRGMGLTDEDDRRPGQRDHARIATPMAWPRSPSIR